MNNLITVVAVIVAAGLAFGAHQYVQQNGDVAELFTLQPRPHEQILDDMRGYQQQLAQLCSQETSEIETLVAAVEHCVDGIDACYEELGRGEIVPQSSEWAAQQISLGSYYLAAKFSPTYAVCFQDQARQIIDIRPSHQHALQARMLIYCQRALDKPFGNEELRQLAREASSYPKPVHGVALYSYLAQELWSAGQAKSAEAVLESGMELYQGQPSRMKLVRQLIDQGHRPAPQPTLTQQQYQDTLQAIESCARKRSSGTRFR